jgi:hypothetical protein
VSKEVIFKDNLSSIKDTDDDRPPLYMSWTGNDRRKGAGKEHVDHQKDPAT